MSQPTVMLSDSFRQRAQLSDLRRIRLWIAVLLALMALLTLRYIVGRAVSNDGGLFLANILLFAAALTYQVLIHQLMTRRIARGELLPERIATISFIADLLVPAAAMAIVERLSPQGAIASVTGPVVLLMPMVILLSIMRLRPRLTLLIGVLACLCHWALTFRAIAVAAPPASQYPMLFTYGIGLFLLGAAGAVVARETRNHVVQITEESAARQAAQRERDRLTHDLELARDIQRSLLPKTVPELQGFTLAGWNQAAEQTGGDYFDWIVLPDGRAILVIADATGHGIGPALLIAVCRAYLRASTRANLPLEAILTQVNQLLLEDMPVGKFVTAAVFILDPATRKGQLYSAGHAPLLFYSAALQTVTSWDADELPLGISSDFGSVRCRQVSFDPGDTLFLLTDGFFEWPDPAGELYGSERLEACVVRNARETPTRMIENLYREVLAFANASPQRDDLTAVVLQCRRNDTPAVPQAFAESGRSGRPGTIGS